MLTAVETAVADSVQLAKSAPVLVQLPERQWGASATLPLDIASGKHITASLGVCSGFEAYSKNARSSLCDTAEGSSSGRIGVIRSAFTPFNVREFFLHTTIASLAEGQAAVNSAAAFEPQGIVVDEYVKDAESGVYRLTNVATDLLRCVTAIELICCKNTFAAVGGHIRLLSTQ